MVLSGKVPCGLVSYHSISTRVQLSRSCLHSGNGHLGQMISAKFMMSQHRLSVPQSLHGSIQRNHSDRIPNEMESKNTDHKSLGPYEVCESGELKFDKTRSDETSGCLLDYDLDALNNCFPDFSHCMSDNAVDLILYYMLKHKNNLDAFSSSDTAYSSNLCFSSGETLIIN